jgi:hypothetical protein
MHSDSTRYDEAIEVKPKGTRTAGTGSVHDPRSHKYPSTHEFASSEAENSSKVDEGRNARRPGGKYRGSGHGFHTVKCHCSSHPCKCKTEEASKEMNSILTGIRRENVNMC